jgi:hypothetical protein
VLDFIRKVLEGAKRDAFFRWIDDVGVAESGVGQDDLGVALCSQGSAFEQRFFVPHTLTVHVLASVDVVDCVHDEVQPQPKGIIEDAFVLRTSPQAICVERNGMVDGLAD